jgi:hypothetical protein
LPHLFLYIGDHIKCLKTILNEATERGNKYMAFKSNDFSKLNEETDKIYPNEKELQEIVLCKCAAGVRWAVWKSP